MDGSTIAAFGGLSLGLCFGALVQRTSFCTSGAISDFALMDDPRRLKSWALAIAVAMLATQALGLAGLDLDRSVYRGRDFSLAPLVGALLFGFGMGIAGGCPSRQMTRAGTGNLVALAGLVAVAVFAYLALRGPLAPPRLLLDRWLAIPDAPRLLATGWGGVAAALAVAAAALVAARRGLPLHASHWIGGVGAGLIVAAGWIVTGRLALDDFDPVPLASLTFVGPLDEALRYSLAPADARASFGIATASGVIAGAFAAAAAQRELRLHAPRQAGEWLRVVAGGACMGAGGVVAIGCSIGQGITGISTLATGSALALLGMLVGGYLGTRTLLAVS